MSGIAALPMYDWPEVRAETDAFWRALRRDVPDLPERLTRPADLGQLQDLWRSPDLILAQTCWGPMRAGLAAHVEVLAQPSYDDVEGGRGPWYRSAIIARDGAPCPVPRSPGAVLPDDLLSAGRLAINDPASLSGALALAEDLGVPDLAQRAALITGSHRASIRAVAEGRADLAAIDCRSWALALRHEPGASRLTVIGWTAERPGLPYITSRRTDRRLSLRLAEALVARGAFIPESA